MVDKNKSQNSPELSKKLTELGNVDDKRFEVMNQKIKDLEKQTSATKIKDQETIKKLQEEAKNIKEFLISALRLSLDIEKNKKIQELIKIIGKLEEELKNEEIKVNYIREIEKIIITMPKYVEGDLVSVEKALKILDERMEELKQLYGANIYEAYGVDLKKVKEAERPERTTEGLQTLIEADRKIPSEIRKVYYEKYRRLWENRDILKKKLSIRVEKKEEQKEIYENISNFEDLYRIIGEKGGQIYSSGRRISAEETIKMIEKRRRGINKILKTKNKPQIKVMKDSLKREGPPLDSLREFTRSGGLRETVKKLLLGIFEESIMEEERERINFEKKYKK